MAPSVVEKLRMLRSFVGDDYSEIDLSKCLSQSAYSVEIAAEKLLTGIFQPKKVENSTSTKRSATITPAKNSNVVKNTTNKKLKSMPHLVTPKTNLSPVSTTDCSWLLCERWVSDGVCTQRHASLNYQETMKIEGGDKMLRFRANRIQGQFPKHLSECMGVLFKEELIHLTAQALMEERGLTIGSQVAFSLSVWIPNPRQFFSLFDQVVSSSVSSENKIFFGKLAKQKNSQSLVCKAAFDLLQWAQYDCGSHAFDKRNQVDSSSNDIESDDEQQEEKLLDEEEVNRPHSVQESQDFGLDLKSNSNEYHEAEPPEEFRCQLRPYQKKALWWMMQRERVEENEQAIRQQLQVLRDLVSSNTKQSETLTSNSDISSIQCECGPVLVNLQECQAPPITDNGTCAHLSHPLWERRFLCSGDQKRALSFYIQPLFGLAVASPPIPPQTCRGGILADSMGLGKTVMLLALIQKSKQEEGKGTTLIVAPLSLLAQWEEELQSKTNLSCQVYYGGDKKVCANIDAFDVILTTYGTLQSEVQWQSKKQKTSDVSEKRFKGGLLGHSWKRAILDEAHVVKNTATVASRACCSLEAERRWCVSGTIIQNSLDDVYSLIKFLGHEPWNSRAFWNTAVTKEENTEIALSRVRQVLTPILMRRTKDSVDETGNPILSLPVMETKTIRVEFSAEERHFYDALFRKSLTLFEGFLRQGTASKSWLAIFSLLHRLRQACDHVALTVKSHVDQDEWSNISNLKEDNKETRRQREKDDNVINSEFLNDLMDRFQSMQNSKTPLCDASYASSIAKMLDEAANSTKSLDECAICLDPIQIESAAVTPCFHLFCHDCLLDILKVGKNDCPVCAKKIDSSMVLKISRSDEGRIQTSHWLNSQPKIQNEDGAARQMLEIAVRGSSSSKLGAIMQELDDVWREDPGSKVLIFSQFLGFLDILESTFSKSNIPFFRFDGKLSLKERVKVLRDFETTSSQSNRVGSVLLLSMKCGGVGLNLVAARSCFIADPWWNAALEDQCVDRIHRIGQTADKVRIRKFFVADSVEERIMELQKRKKSVATKVLCDTNSSLKDSPTGRPTLDDFKVLFQNARFD